MDPKNVKKEEISCFTSLNFLCRGLRRHKLMFLMGKNFPTIIIYKFCHNKSLSGSGSALDPYSAKYLDLDPDSVNRVRIRNTGAKYLSTYPLKNSKRE
jgi:hypothetical protein